MAREQSSHHTEQFMPSPRAVLKVQRSITLGHRRRHRLPLLRGVLVPSCLEPVPDLLGEAGQFVHVLVTTGNGTHLEFFLIFGDLGVGSGRRHLVPHFVLAGQDATVKGLLEPLKF